MGRLLVIPLALLLLLAAAMIWSAESRGRPAEFSLINRGEIKTLDPNRMSWLQDIRVGYALWEGLYTLDPETLDAIPGTAETIDISPDKTVYTFHIRPEARWSNGDDVRAQDFVFAWRRMLEQIGDYTYLLYYIRGAENYAAEVAALKKSQSTTQPKPDLSGVGIEVIDDKTLRVKLKHPVSFFPQICAFPPTFPLHEPSMRRFERKDEQGYVTYDDHFTRPPYLVTNGPYVLAMWEFKRSVRLEASTLYWDRKNVKMSSIEVVSNDDPLGSFQQYDSGGVQWLAEISPEIAAELKARGRSDLHVFPGFGTYFYSINCQPRFNDGTPNPFADARVRRAFSMAIDKSPIGKTITRMGEPPAEVYIPPGIFAGYSSPKGLPYDPAAARKLLVEGNFPDGRGFPQITLLYNKEGHHGLVAQYVTQQWATNLNIHVQLEGVENKIFGERLHNKDYAIARASWIGDYDDPSTFTDKYKSNSDNNDSGWASAQYDGLCNQAEVEADAAERLKKLSRAEQVLCDEAPIIPLYFYVNSYLYRDNVKGISLSPRNMVMLKWVEVQH